MGTCGNDLRHGLGQLFNNQTRFDLPGKEVGLGMVDHCLSTCACGLMAGKTKVVCSAALRQARVALRIVLVHVPFENG